MSFSKRCKICGKTYSLPDFFALALPDNGIGQLHGLHWRNCECGGTLVVPEDAVPSITTKSPEAA